MSSGWRKGPSAVPLELLHRPPYLIKHIMAAELRSMDITADMVHADDDGHKFYVQLSRDTDKRHTVDVGDSYTTPFCSCRHFFRTRLPCKHFQAVFRHTPDMSFASLPVHYRDHPLFVVDEAYANATDATLLPATADLSGSYDADDVDDVAADNEQQAEDSDEPCNAKLARECRELAAVLVNYTYDVVQEDTLLRVRQSLNDAVTVLEGACPSSGGLPVRAEANTSRDDRQRSRTKDTRGVATLGHKATRTPSDRQKTLCTSARPSKNRRRARATEQQAATKDLGKS